MENDISEECVNHDNTQDVVPDLCSTIHRKGPLMKCLDVIDRTSTQSLNHKACVCVVCDCFIIGTEKVCWLKEEQLQQKSAILSTCYLESNAGKKLPSDLRDQYKIFGNETLSDLLLSPRAHSQDGSFMACEICHRNIAYTNSDFPPKFAISNGCCIGKVPNDIIDGEVSEILESSVARIRIFANIYSYNAGAHKAIKGHHIYFLNDPEHVGATFEYLVQSGAPPDIYVMICGRVTPSQREIIKRRCTINTNEYKALMNWLIDHHPSYSQMERPQCTPRPIILGGFDETTNNTDVSDEDKVCEENRIDTEQMTFAARNEPSQSTGPFRSEKDFVFSHIKGQKPTLLFRNGDIVGSHIIDLVDLFPLVFHMVLAVQMNKEAQKLERVLY